MSGYHLIAPKQQLDQANITVVASRFNQQIVDRLVDGCLQVLRKSGLPEQAITVVRVPGAFEIPLAAQHAIIHTPCDAVITLGTIIRGETRHFDYIAAECSRGIAKLSLKHGIPVIFGVLTVDTIDQARARADAKKDNKGAEAAQAAIEMINVLRMLQQ